MEQRLNIEKLLPTAWQSMYGLSGSVKGASLTPIQMHLIKIRASQLNGCASCLNMHTKHALTIGETQQRIFLLSAWKEASVFTAEEKLILTITEEITRISENGLSEQTYQNGIKLFGDTMLAEIIMTVVIINAWNRIAISAKLNF
jgi:AhpD family alkylhydroperoxidase